MAEEKESNLALYRKFRPQNFSNLKGQEHIQTTLLNALKKNSVAHAYLFSGPRGTGKTSTARLVAKGLNCLNLKETGEPCNECEMCESVNKNGLVDIIEIDAASNRGIDEIRDIREKIKFSPVRGKRKVYIIDEVHMLTDYAFNALLKTLEEPPSHAHLILATTEVHKIPATIVSRCQHFDFKRIDESSMLERLIFIAHKEGIDYEEEAIKIIIESSDGSMRDAIGLLEQMTMDKKVSTEYVQKNLGLVNKVIVDTFIDLLEKKNAEEGVKFINKIYTDGIELLQLVRETKEALRKRLITDVGNENKERVLFVLHILKLLDTAEKEIKSATIPQLPLELLFVELTYTEPTKPAETPPASSKPETPSSTEKAPEKKPESQSPAQSSISLDSIRSQWGVIVESISETKVKFALRQASLKSLKDGELTITLSSPFEYDQINNVKHRNTIEEAIKDKMSDHVSITLTYEKTAPVPEEEPVKHIKQSTPEKQPDASVLQSLTSQLGATVIKE